MSRLILAITGAALAASTAHGIVMVFMWPTVGGYLPMFALAAALYGAAFAVGVLVPLWLMFRRRTSRLWWNLAVPAVALWVTLAVGFYAVVPADLSPAEVLGNALTVVPAGVAEVVAFVFLIRSRPRPPT